MAVYVDSAMVPYRGMKMSHMVADTLEELHGMADQLGLNRKWFQNTKRPHYDVCAAYRTKAIALGALPVNSRDIVEICRRNRLT